MYCRVSAKDKKAKTLTEVRIYLVPYTASSPNDLSHCRHAIVYCLHVQEEAKQSVSSLAPADLPAAMSSSIRVGQSWRVSDDEFIIKIDASPLHMSAAQRMFGGKKQAPPLSETINEEPVAIIDEAPLHLSASRRMFGGTASTGAEEQPTEEHANDWGHFFQNMWSTLGSGKSA